MSERGPRLRIDPAPEHVAVARGFAAAVLQTLGAPDETIESVRLVMSELITVLVNQPSGPIVVEFDPSRRTLLIDSSGPLPEVTGPARTILDGIAGVTLDNAGDTWLIGWQDR